jgi:hypothetical protein
MTEAAAARWFEQNETVDRLFADAQHALALFVRYMDSIGEEDGPDEYWKRVAQLGLTRAQMESVDALLTTRYVLPEGA